MGAELQRRPEVQPVEQPGPRRTKGAPSPGEVVSRVQQILASERDLPGKLALLFFKDPGAFQSIMQLLKPSIGPEAYDQLVADITERKTRGESQGKSGNQPTPDRAALFDMLVERVKGALGLEGDAHLMIQQGGPITDGAVAENIDGGVIMVDLSVDPSTSQGKEVVAHEVAHEAQRQNQVANPDIAAAEAEATQIGQDFANNQPLAAPTQAVPAGTPVQYGGDGAGPPDKLKLSVAGIPVEAELGTPTKTVTVGLNAEPVTGLKLTNATVNFGADWDVKSGEVTGSLTLGSFASKADVKLTINAGGNVALAIDGVQLAVGDLMTATMGVTIASDGITGNVKVDFGNINLGMGLSLTEGQLQTHLAADGKVTANGTLKAAVSGIGTLTLGADVTDTTVEGRATLVVDQAIELGAGVSITTGTVTGDFNQSGFTLDGGAKVAVNDWAEGDLTAKYVHQGPWSVKGTVKQKGQATFGEMTVSEGSLGVIVDSGNLQEIKASGHYVVPHFEGNIGGTYNAGARTFSGKATIELTSTADLPGGIKLTKAKGDVTLKDNTLETMTGSATAQFPFKGEPTFEMTFENVTYKMPDNKVSGSATLKTLKDVTVGPEGGIRAIIAAGATVGVEIADSKITTVNGQLSFTVHDKQGEVGSGSISAEFKDNKLGGSAEFTLSTDLGFPERQAGPCVLKSGSSISLKAENDALKSITLSNCNFAVIKLGSDQSGELSGSVSGSIDVAESTLTANGSVSVSKAIKLTAGDTTVTLKSGTVTADVKKNDLQEITVDGVGYSVATKLDGQALAADGTIDNGKYKDGKVSGKVTATLTTPFEYKKGKTTVTLHQGAKLSAQVTDNELKEFTASNIQFDVNTEIAGKTIDLSGDIQTCSYAGGSFTVKATATINQPVAFGTGKPTVTLTGGSAAIDIQAGELKELGVNGVTFKVDSEFDGNPIHLKGDIKTGKVADDGVTVEASVELASPFVYEKDPAKLTVKPGAKASISIQKSEFKELALTNLGFEFEATIQGETLKIGGSISEGKVSDAGFDLDATAKLLGPFKYTQSPVTVTLQSGEAALDVKGSKLKKAGINNVEFDTDIDVDGKKLELAGRITTGKIENDLITIDASANLEKPFEIKKDPVTAVLLKGAAKLDVKDSELIKVGFGGIEAKADIKIGEDTMKLLGHVKEGGYEGGKISFKGALALVEDFTFQAGKASCTLEKGGVAMVDVADSTLVEAGLQNVGIQASIDVGQSNPLKLKGKVETGKYKSGAFDVKGELSLDGAFQYGTDGVTANFESGKITVDVQQSQLKSATFDLKATVDIDVKGQKLKLGGSVSGRINADNTLDLDGTINLLEDFVYEQPPVKATLAKGASLKVKLEKNKLKFAKLEGVKVTAEITISGSVLKLEGNVSGQIDEGQKLDISGSIKVVDDFVYEQSPVKATLCSGGKVEFKVEKSTFKFAKLTGFKVLTDIDIKGSTLKLEGRVNGQVDENFKVDLDGSIAVTDDFVYEQPPVKATLCKGGKLDLKLEKSTFKYAKLSDFKVLTDVDIKGSALKLEGTVNGQIDEAFKIDLDGSIKVTEDFVYEQAPVKATLCQGGQLDFKVNKSTFKFAKLTGFKVLADITIKGQVLKLEGKLDGQIDEAFKIDLDGSIKVTEDFVYEQNPVKATLCKDGQLDIKVDKSTFKFAKLTNFKVLADITIKGQVLKLEGKLDGQIDENYKVDLDGSIKVTEDFVYEQNPVKATLCKDGQLDIKVDKSTFKFAKLTNFKVLADITIKGQVLKLEGKLDGQIDENYKVDLDGSIKVTEDFVYEQNPVKATLCKDGQLDIKVDKSTFKYAKLTNFKVLADITIKGQVLKLEGKLNGQIDENYKVDLDGSIKVTEDFVYEQNPVKATLCKDGQLDIKVDKSTFKYAKLTNFKVLADITIKGQVLKLEGKLDGQIDENYKVDLDGSIKVTEDFVYEQNPVKATLCKDGQLDIKVDKSTFKYAKLTNFKVLADITIKGQVLKLEGKLNGQIDENYKVDLDGSIKVTEDFVYEQNPVKATLCKDGQLDIKVDKSTFKYAKLTNFKVLADITIKGQVLKLEGKLNGQIDENYKVDLDGSIKVTEDFVYEQNPVKATLCKDGQLDIKVDKSTFKYAKLTNFKVLADITIKGQVLKLEGKLNGQIDENYKVDLDGSIKVTEDFVHDESPVKATLCKDGQLDIKVDKSTFKYAKLTNFKVLADITIKGQVLKLEGRLDGQIDENYKVDLDGSIKVTEDFVYEESPVKATLCKDGELGIKVEKNTFKYAKLTGFKVLADIEIEGKTLKLEGRLNGQIDENYKIDLDGNIKVVEDFVHEQDPVKVTLCKDGELDIKVEKNTFKYAKLTGFKVLADITIKGQVLKLEGNVNGQIDENYKVDFDGTIEVVEDFVYEQTPVKATLCKGGKLTVKVEKNKFKFAKLTGFKILADITIQGSVLKLEGSVNGEIDEAYKIDFDGTIKVVSDFVLDKKPVKLTLCEGGQLEVKVEKSKFKFAKLTDFNVLADIDIKGQTLKLGGAINGMVYDNYEVDLDGSIKVLEDFVYETGNIKATLVANGELTLKVARNKFKFAKLANFKVLVDATIDGKVLKLEGSVKGKIDENYKVDVDGTIKVLEDFVYEKDPIKATLKANGMVRVVVEQSKFKFAEFKGIVVEVEVTVTGADTKLCLKASLDNGKYVPDEGITFDARLEVTKDFIYKKDPITATLKAGGFVQADVAANKLKKVTFGGIVVLVDVKVTGAKTDLKLKASLDKGTYTPDSGISFVAELEVTADFIYEKDPVKATLKAGGKVTATVESNELKLVEFSGIQVLVDVTIPGAKSKLCLKASLETGSYKPGEGLTFKAELEVVSDFIYEKSIFKATLKAGGRVEADVQKNDLKVVTFGGILVLIDVKVPDAQTPLKLKARLDKGTYTPGVGVSFVAGLEVAADFSYSKGPIKATLKQGGKVTATVENSELKEVAFDGIVVEIEAKVPGAQTPLALKGSLSKGSYKPGEGITFKARLEVAADFIYVKDPVSAILRQGGFIEVDIQKNEFKGCTFGGIEVLLSVKIPGAETPLQLKGTLDDGSYVPNEGITFTAGIEVAADFIYKKGPFTGTLKKGGSLKVTIEKNKFVRAEFTGIKLIAEVKVGEGTLKIKGTLDDGKYENGLIEFTAGLELMENFVYTLGKVKVTFMKGASLKVRVEESKFKWAELSGLEVVAEFELTAGKKLKIGGSLTKGRYEDGKVDVLGTLTVLTDFDYKLGPVDLKLHQGGSLTVCVEQSEFKWAELAGIKVTAKVEVNGKTLELGGEIAKGRYENGKIDVEGSVTLLKAFTLEFGPITATVAQGGKFTVKITQSEFEWAKIENIKIDVVAELSKDKKLELEGRIDKGCYYKDGKIDFEGGISLKNEVTLLGGDGSKFSIILKEASVDVNVVQSKLKQLKATGTAAAFAAFGDGKIWGDLSVTYIYEEGGKDEFEGKGTLNVEMLNKKLHGSVTVEVKESGKKWKIDGELTYQMNKYIKGKVTLSMDQELDPIIGGSISVTNAELYPGRDLIRKKFQIVPPIGANITVVTFGVGCDAEIAVVLNPVLFNTTVSFSDWRPLGGKMVPDFEADASVTGGIALEAAIKPYLFLGLGVPTVSAGIKIQGGVTLKVPVDLTASLKLFGREGKYGGELGVGVAVRPSLTLSIQPMLYARAGSLNAEHPMMDPLEYTFPDLFTFEWGASYTFGDVPKKESKTSPPAPTEKGGSVSQEAKAEEKKEGDSPRDETGAAPSTDKDQPNVGKAEQKEKKGGEASKMEKKMKEIEEYAEHLGNIAKLVDFVVTVITIGALLTFLGPVGWLVAVVIALIKVGGPGALVKGIKSLFWFIRKLAAWIWSLMPDWFKKAYRFIVGLIEKGAHAAAVEVSKKIKEWGKTAFPSPWNYILEPLINWAADSAYKFIKAFEGFNPANPIDWVRFILKLVMAAITSLVDFFEAIGDVIDRLLKVIEHYVVEGRLVATCTDPDDWGMNPWFIKVDAPGFWEGYTKGPSDSVATWAIGNAMSWAIKKFTSIPPNTHVKKDYGYEYPDAPHGGSSGEEYLIVLKFKRGDI